MQIIRPLLVTLFLEWIAAWIIGIRDRHRLWILGLVNAITNPILNITIILMGLYLPVTFTLVAIHVMEVLIVLVEGWLFKKFLADVKHPFWLALYLNAVSFFLGGFTQRWILLLLPMRGVGPVK